MKSAYELAMERLGGNSNPLSDEQKQQIADIHQKMEAKLAEQAILFDQRIVETVAQMDGETLVRLKENRETELCRIRDHAEAEKDRVRNQKA
jgi:hypothetical protein